MQWLVDCQVPSRAYVRQCCVLQILCLLHQQGCTAVCRTIDNLKQLAAFLLAVLPGEPQQRAQQLTPYQQLNSQWKQGIQKQAEQEQRRREREGQQKQQRAQRRMQRTLVLGRDGDGELETAAAAAAAAAGADAAPPMGSRKRKQRSPVRVAQQQAGALAGPVAEAEQEQAQQDAMHAPVGQDEGSLPPTRPASAAGLAAEAEVPLLPPAVQLRQPAQVTWQQRSPAATLGSAPAQPGGRQQQQVQQEQQQQVAAAEAGAGLPAQAGQGPLAGEAAPAATAQAAGSSLVSLPLPSPASAALVAGRVAEAAQRKVEQAMQAFAVADRNAAASMLPPLQHILRALGKKGGAALQVSSSRGSRGFQNFGLLVPELLLLACHDAASVPAHLHFRFAVSCPHLQEVVASWSSYPLERHQELFDAALAVASEGDWGQLEGQLRLALDLTAEG